MAGVEAKAAAYAWSGRSTAHATNADRAARSERASETCMKETVSLPRQVGQGAGDPRHLVQTTGAEVPRTELGTQERSGLGRERRILVLIPGIAVLAPPRPAP